MTEKEISFYEKRIHLMERFLIQQKRGEKEIVVLKLSTVEEIIHDYRNMLEEAKADRIF